MSSDQPPEHPAAARAGRLLAADSDMRIEELPDRIYQLRVFRHISRALLAAALQVIWASPRWRQPWGLVIVVEDGATYDSDVRKHEMPPNDRRAVGTSVVTTKQMHRMVIKSIGIGYSLVSRFVMSAHENLEEAVAFQRDAVLKAVAEGRPF
jgi:hypothetical protein